MGQNFLRGKKKSLDLSIPLFNYPIDSPAEVYELKIYYIIKGRRVWIHKQVFLHQISFAPLNNLQANVMRSCIINWRSVIWTLF